MDHLDADQEGKQWSSPVSVYCAIRMPIYDDDKKNVSTACSGCGRRCTHDYDVGRAGTFGPTASAVDELLEHKLARLVCWRLCENRDDEGGGSGVRFPHL